MNSVNSSVPFTTKFKLLMKDIEEKEYFPEDWGKSIKEVTSHITLDKKLIKFLRYFCYFPPKFLTLRSNWFLSSDVTERKNYNCLINIKGKVYVERLPITKAAYITKPQKFYLKKIGREEKHSQAKSKNWRCQKKESEL